MAITIALTGNPNSGKTTMFNALTGSTQYVGNWPGVTVEKKEGKLKSNHDIKIMDLPGIYSLSPYTLEEIITRDYLMQDKPDAIINTVDASNIERNLYLTTQILEMGIPVVVALNLIDVAQKRGDKIDIAQLSKELGCPVIETSATRGDGLDELMAAAEQAANAPPTNAQHRFDAPLEKTLDELSALLPASIPAEQQRWYTVKLFERDEKAISPLSLDAALQQQAEAIIKRTEAEYDDDSESITTTARYDYITTVVAHTVKKKQTGLTTSDKIDKIVTNRWLALPIFVLVMGVVYFIAVTWLGAPLAELVTDGFFGGFLHDGVTTLFTNIGASPILLGLVRDGLLAGVGAVLGFIPQMIILFLCLSLLEDCGYMARIAFIMDRVFRKFGLSGKSFIPMLISSGCAVPGIAASRTIENEKDRKMTIILTPLIPCSAKLPVIALIGGSLFPGKFWVAPLIYFIGVFAIIVSGIILKKVKLFLGDPAPFVMELPEYRVPNIKNVARSVWERTRGFIVKAGTIIFLASALIWFLSNFGFAGQGFHYLTEAEMTTRDGSLLAVIGNVIAPIFAPLGFGNWQSAVATVSGLIAKENLVATFGIIFGLGSEVTETSSLLHSEVSGLFGGSGVAALAFLVFNMLCAPCFAAIGATREEMGSAKWTWIAVGYQTLLAYVLALIINQIGSVLFMGASVGIGTIVAIAAILAIVWLLVRPSSTPKPQTQAS